MGQDNDVRRWKFYIFFLLLFLLVLVSQLSKAANLNGFNNKNVSVRTNVNITNSRPEVLNILIYPDFNNSQRNITLNAGSTRDVMCNATLRDWNSYSDIVLVNATLWDVRNSEINATDNNNTHYTNYNCTNTGNGVNYTVNYMCNFTVYYYANNGTWNCNISVMDLSNTSGTRGNRTFFSSVYAVNITDGISYGSAAVEDYTINTTANITNFGNMPINVTVEGYGARLGDGLAMNCSLGGNITIDNERYSVSDVEWASRIPLSTAPTMLNGLTIQKQTLPATLVENTTYWEMFINSTNNPGGNCSGYVIFTAIAS